MARYLTSRISALVKELMPTFAGSEPDSADRLPAVLKFVLEQIDRMPWFASCAVKTMTLLFVFSSFLGAAFPLGSNRGSAYKRQLDAWSRSSFRPFRDFVKFYAAMAVLAYYSDSKSPLNASASDE